MDKGHPPQKSLPNDGDDDDDDMMMMMMMMNLLLCCCGGPTPKLFIGENDFDSLERVFDNFLWFGCGFPKDTPKNSPKFFCVCVW